MLRWIWIALSSVAVLAGAGLLLLKLADRPPEPESPAEDTRTEERVRAEFDYYVLLPVIEVAPAKEGDAAWDAGGSGPDLYYRIHWQGNRIFESSVKEDALLAKWSNVSVDLGDLREGVSIDGSIHAARIAARPGDRLVFEVFDSDLVDDDLVGRWEVPVEELRLGDQVWEQPAGALVRVTCRVLPLDQVAFEALTK